MWTIENEENYAAQCIEVTNLIQYSELDNLVGIPFAGYVALVSKGQYVPGDKVVIFPAECQLSEDLCKDHNLYAHKELNSNQEVKGYLGKNRRVKALKLRGIYSTALALPASDFNDPPVGTSFDTVDGIEVCRKYIIPVKHNTPKFTPKKEQAIEERYFPLHYDTAQYLRNSFKYNPDKPIYVSQKVHGTSWRGARTYKKRKLNLFERLAKKVGIPVEEYAMALVGGSRKVTKDPTDSDQNHYYSTDIWSNALERYGDLIPDNHIIYGELIGWVDENTPIQSGYTYDLKRGEYRLVVYRVAAILPDGTQVEYGFDAMQEFCRNRGLDSVPLLDIVYRTSEEDDEEFYSRWADHRFKDEGISQAIQLSDPDTVDEGVVFRQDGIVPLLTKLKGPVFYGYETKVLDEEKDILE